MSVVRWGIVGPGRIADRFASDLRRVANARLVAVASRSLATAESFVARHGAGRAYAGYQPLFDDEEVDAVYIATPHTLHARQSRAAIAAGKAVLCEKPLTVSPDECRDLQRYARREGRSVADIATTFGVSEIMVRRALALGNLLPAIRKAREWIDAGRIGRVRHIRADFGYPLPYEPRGREYDSALAGGCLLDMGIYPVALAQLVFGEQPARLEVLHHLAPNGVDDDVVALCGYDDRTAILAASFRCKLPNCAYLVGEEGYIAIPDFWRADSCHLYELDERKDSFQDDRQGTGFEFEIDAVSADILAGRLESATVTAADSLAFQLHMARIKAQFGP